VRLPGVQWRRQHLQPTCVYVCCFLNHPATIGGIGLAQNSVPCTSTASCTSVSCSNCSPFLCHCCVTTACTAAQASLCQLPAAGYGHGCVQHSPGADCRLFEPAIQGVWAVNIQSVLQSARPSLSPPGRQLGRQAAGRQAGRQAGRRRHNKGPIQRQEGDGLQAVTLPGRTCCTCLRAAALHCRMLSNVCGELSCVECSEPSRTH
jgi:hypothetical protein